MPTHKGLLAGRTVALILSFVLCMDFTTAARSEVQRLSPSISITVTQVHESPGFWSGILEADQWIDGTIQATSDRRYSVGKQLHVGIAVVHGDRLFEKDEPQFDPTKISAGKLLTVELKEHCFHEVSKDRITVDPSCIKL